MRGAELKADWGVGPHADLHPAPSSPDRARPVTAMQIQPLRTSVHTPWQNGVAERWVGSCRRELLDHVIVFDEDHLQRLLSEFLDYYHQDRIHFVARQGCATRPPRVHGALANGPGDLAAPCRWPSSPVRVARGRVNRADGIGASHAKSDGAAQGRSGVERRPPFQCHPNLTIRLFLSDAAAPPREAFVLGMRTGRGPCLISAYAASLRGAGCKTSARPTRSATTRSPGWTSPAMIFSDSGSRTYSWSARRSGRAPNAGS